MARTNDWAAQLASLRGMTSAAGGLHEAQLFNLKMWGALAFEYVKAGGGSWEADVDLEEKTVTYNLTVGKKRKPKQLPSLMAALDRSIHFLLGNDWQLIVQENRKLIYKGDCEASDVSQQRNARAARAAGRPAAK